MSKNAPAAAESAKVDAVIEQTLSGVSKATGLSVDRLAAKFYNCEACVLPDVVSTASSADTAPAERLGDLFSARHAMAAGFPVQVGDLVVIGYDDRGLEPVYVIEGSLPVPVGALVGEMRVLRAA